MNDRESFVVSQFQEPSYGQVTPSHHGMKSRKKNLKTHVDTLVEVSFKITTTDATPLPPPWGQV